MKKENLVFECPKCLSEAIVVPTGNVAVSGDAATVEVWKDGKIVNISVDTLGTYPAVVTDGKLAKEYALHICAAVETEKSGVYNLVSLGFATDENGTYIGLNKTRPELLDETEVTTENMFFIKNDVVPVSPVKKIDRYFQNASNKVNVPTKSIFLGDFSFGQYDFDITNWAGTRKKFDAGKTAFVKDFSRILVKYNFTDGKTEWVVFDAAALPLMVDISFKTLSYIVANNPTNGLDDESCMAGEDLLFLFGEVDVPEEKVVELALGERAEVNLDAALYETLRFRVKINGDVSEEDAVLTYERKDGAVGERKFKLYSAGVDAEGYHVFEIKMREVLVWQNTICALTITLPEGSYELDYVKLAPTGNSSDVKLGKALPMFSDGNFEKGFVVRGMEHGLVPSDTYFATVPGADKAREEYENAVKDDESIKDKYYADWQFQPLYAYDYINSYPVMKQAGLSYANGPKERIEGIKETDPEIYKQCYLDYELTDDGKPTAEGYFKLADKAGAKEIYCKHNQTYTTTDGVERHGTVLEIALNGKKMFHGNPYSKYDKNNNPDGTWRFWPHLLIEQNSGTRPVDFENEIQYSTGADRLYCEFDIRLKEYNEEYTRKVHPDGIERDTGHMSFLLYSYLRPKKDPGTLVWFGLALASDNLYYSQYSDVNWCRDSGANTYMYCLSAEAVYSGFSNSIHNIIQKGRKAEGYTKGTKISSDWIHIKVDLTHHIGIILDRVNAEDAYGLGVTTKDDWFFNGVNIGFETSDNVDCTFEMANFNFYSYNIEE
ncbi:MAG: hypothetical protein IJW06_04340 [Clostridia bacterium]|nr:hypothetical protein [Clostridia bacterium]